MSRRKKVRPPNSVNGPLSSMQTGAAIYKPKFITATLHIPPDNRTDAEKACDYFQLFANDLNTWGLDDAIGMWFSMTDTTPLPVHPGDCAACRFTRATARRAGSPGRLRGVPRTSDDDALLQDAGKTRKPTYAFGIIAFVAHPHLHGLYIKTHVCVNIVACKACGAELYEPCRSTTTKRSGVVGVGGGTRWLAATHHQRRKDAGVAVRREGWTTLHGGPAY